WGDGDTSPAKIVRKDDDLEVHGSHIYAAAGSYLLTVTIDDETGHEVQTFSTALVKGPPFEATASEQSFTEGVAYDDIRLGAIAISGDNPGGYSATVDWGDGQGPVPATIVGTGSNLWVMGSYTYAHQGEYLLTLTVVDCAGVPSVSTAAVHVYDGNPLFLSTFADTASAPSYHATASWDSPPAVVDFTVGTVVTVTGYHPWTTSGAHSVDVVLTNDNEPTSATSHRDITIAEAPLLPVSMSALTGVQGAALTD